MALRIIRINRSQLSGFSRGRIPSELHFEKSIDFSVEIAFERTRVNDNEELSVYHSTGGVKGVLRPGKCLALDCPVIFQPRRPHRQ